MSSWQGLTFQSGTNVHHVNDVIGDADETNTHQQGEGCGNNYAGVFAKPLKKDEVGTDSEERNLGRREKKENNADSTTDDACNKGDHHGNLEATEC